MNRYRPPEGPASAAELKAEILNLAKQIVQVDNSIQRLASRLRVPDNFGNFEHVRNWGQLVALRKEDNKPIKEAPELTEIRNAVGAIKWALDGVFRDIGLIRAHMDAVANDAYLSDQFKAYLAPIKKD